MHKPFVIIATDTSAQPWTSTIAGYAETADEAKAAVVPMSALKGSQTMYCIGRIKDDGKTARVFAQTWGGNYDDRSIAYSVPATSEGLVAEAAERAADKIEREAVKGAEDMRWSTAFAPHLRSIGSVPAYMANARPSLIKLITSRVRRTA